METAADKIFSFKEYPSQFPEEFIKLRVSGKNSSKYFINENSDYILYFEFIEDFKELPSEIQEYLKENKKSLKDRATVKNEGRTWWRYSRPMHKEYYTLPKLFCSRRASKNAFSIDEGFNFLSFSNMTVIFETNDKISLKYVLTLFNSKLLNFRYKSIGKQTGGGIYEYFPNGVSKLPIPEITWDKQKSFIELANKMTQLNKKIANAKSPHEKKLIEKQIISTDKKIDKAVYELYELNDEETKIIEDFFE